MTRANFTIVTREGKFKMQGNSSCYPEEVLPRAIKFMKSTESSNPGATNGFYDEPDSSDIADFIQKVGLTFGSVGNPSYFYDIDFVKHSIKVYDTKSRWVNAPADWEEKGWSGVWERNGKMGWMNHNVKGKCIHEEYFVKSYLRESKLKQLGL
jgi:hypothetical protein